MRRTDALFAADHDARRSSWDLLRDPGSVREWTVDPAHGLVQGPLDLSFFDRGLLILHLVDDQVALVENEGAVQRVLLAGAHHLTVGTGAGALPPSTRLIFLHTDRPLELNWRTGSALWIEGPAGKRQTLPVIGACSLVVADPVSFHGAFLKNIEILDPDLLERVVDALVRTRLEAHLGQVGTDPDTGAVETQTMLAGLTAEDIDGDLEEYGLACRNLALYTQRPPVEEENGAAADAETSPGQNPVRCDNGP